MPWGNEAGIGKGPPSQYERQLMGAVLLLLLGALALIFTARKNARPGRMAIAIAGLSSVGAVGLALSVRSSALAAEHGHVLLGGGWVRMAAGAFLAVGAAASAATLSFSKGSASQSSQTKVAKSAKKKSR